MISELWICFEPPAEEPPSDVILLSFMLPGAEAAMAERHGARVVSGRDVVQEVRLSARAEYVNVIARLGATPCPGGRTLRQVLQGPAPYSRWWFLGVTEKDCLWDEDIIYLTILQLKAVEALKEKYQVERLRLHGAAPAFTAALGQNAVVPGAIAQLAGAITFGVLGRLALLVEYLGTWWTLRTLPRPAGERRDVLLQGYWDWTVRPDSEGRLQDRYFTDLPGQLAARGLRVGWLASCEPRMEPWQRGRRTRDVIAASCGHPEITLLERFLGAADILRVVSNLRYAVQATRVVLGRTFRSGCRIGAGDLYPVVRGQILREIWGSTVCRLQLVALATSRACRRIRPSVVLTAFELLLRARALSAGVRAGTPDVPVWAAQHAGYSTDKTLGVFDPEIELRGVPDGCAMPAPHGVFAMGELSRRIWETSGFASENVVLTGGLRYQTVRIESRAAKEATGQVNVLLAGGMCEAAHVDLCDAALAATAGLESVRLYWRDHPNYRFSERRPFRRFRNAIAATSGTLDEDFRRADLVLFVQTGLAEEALLHGIPTWQWLWPGVNASPFVDMPVIPSFTTVSGLRRELEAFIEDPTRYRPAPKTQHRVLHECFGPDPAGASARIAEAVHQIVVAAAVA